MDIRRFGPEFRSPRYTLALAWEVASKYFGLRHPLEEREAGRPSRVSPLYGRREALGCVFGEKAGWERASWFGSSEELGDETLRPRGAAGRHWSRASGAEALATRRAAGLFDLTSFSKLAVTGPGALAFLQRVCANDLERPTGSIAYTQALNERGGIACDFTVTRLSVEDFLIVTGTAFGIHDRTWLESHAPSDGSVVTRDVTSEYACLGLWGPRAREILASVTADDVGNEAFPYLTAQTIAVDGRPVLALRVTNVGELGWELYVAMERAGSLWDGLLEAGRPLGLRPAGYRAADSLRLAKGYPAPRADLPAEHPPDEAGLSFAVRLQKASGFIGREALRARREDGLTRKLACLIVE